MKTIAIMNNKGGVGKTITAINLAEILVAEHGKRVVLVDCDGQMNLTNFYFPKFDPEVNFDMADLILGDGEPAWSENLMPIKPDLDLIPASTDLYQMDLEAIRDGAHEPLRLREFVQSAEEDGEVDYFICDCPPGFTVASVAALLAADEVIIPLTVDGFSIKGMEAMWRQLRTLKNTGVKIAGVLITQWHNSQVVHVGEKLIRSLDVPVFETTIRRTDKVPESTIERLPMAEYSPGSAATKDYRAFVREYLGV